ncbi:MAG: hypothetical protein ABL949_12805 [Fimbriimonadaceae bacterium]
MGNKRIQFGDFKTINEVVQGLPEAPGSFVMELKKGLDVHDMSVRPAETPAPVEDSGLTGLVTIRGELRMNDYEAFGRDEWMIADNLVAWTYVDGQFLNRFYWEGRCGGELRLEVDMKGGINPNAPDVLEFGAQARLYEGSSTSTSDLDGTENFHTQVDRGSTRSFYGLVRNTAEGQPMDWGSFSFWVRFE